MTTTDAPAPDPSHVQDSAAYLRERAEFMDAEMKARYLAIADELEALQRRCGKAEALVSEAYFSGRQSVAWGRRAVALAGDKGDGT